MGWEQVDLRGRPDLRLRARSNPMVGATQNKSSQLMELLLQNKSNVFIAVLGIWCWLCGRWFSSLPITNLWCNQIWSVRQF